MDKPIPLRASAVAASMRDSSYWRCVGCGYRWSAPAASACPKCHSLEIKREGQRHYDYARA